jgi:two-component system, response regulator PdtaR
MSRLTVLVAEDDAVTRLDVCRILERAGYRIGGEAGNGRDAVARAVELHPDVVVLDVGLPRLNGVEVARQILADAAIPIVLLTGYGYGTTPSLPSLPWVAEGCGSSRLSRFRSESICDWWPLVAPAGLHKCSMPEPNALGLRTF